MSGDKGRDCNPRGFDVSAKPLQYLESVWTVAVRAKRIGIDRELLASSNCETMLRDESDRASGDLFRRIQKRAILTAGNQRPFFCVTAIRKRLGGGTDSCRARSLEHMVSCQPEQDERRVHGANRIRDEICGDAIARREIVQCSVRLHMVERGSRCCAGFRDNLDLLDEMEAQLLGAELLLPPSEPELVGKRRVRTDGDSAIARDANGITDSDSVSGVIPAGDVRR